MLINLVIQVVAGAIGGYAIGAGVKDINLGTLGNIAPLGSTLSERGQNLRLL